MNANVDTLEGNNYPINSREQKKVVDMLEALDANIRNTQLIKEVRFKVEIEYFPKDMNILKEKEVAR